MVLPQAKNAQESVVVHFAFNQAAVAMGGRHKKGTRKDEYQKLKRRREEQPAPQAKSRSFLCYSATSLARLEAIFGVSLVRELARRLLFFRQHAAAWKALALSFVQESDQAPI